MRAAWRWLRTSNRYLFEIPETPVVGGLRLLRRRPIATTGHLARGGESKSKKGVLKAMLAEALGLPDLLTARRSAVEKMLGKEKAT